MRRNGPLSVGMGMPMRKGKSFAPEHLGLRVLYDHRASSAAGMVDQSGNGVADATVGGGSNSPLWLPYTVPSLYLPDNSGNSVRCPHSATFTFHLGGTFDVLLATAYTNGAAVQQLLGDPGTVGGAGLRMDTYSRPNLIVRNGGASFVTAVATAAVPAGTRRIVASWTTTDVTFYAAPDDTSALTQVGDVVTFSATLTESASFLSISNNGSNLFPLNAVSRATARNAADETVAEFNAALCGQTGYTDPYGNVWTVSRATSGRKLVVQSPAANSAIGQWLAGPDDYWSGDAAAISPATNAVSASAWCAARLRATQVADDVLFSTRTGTGAGVTLRLASATTIVADVSDGTTTNTTPAVSFTPGQMVVAGVFLDAAGTAFVRVNGTTGSTVARPANTQTGGTLTIAADSTPANYTDGGFICGYTAADYLLDDLAWAQVVAFYGGGL